LKPKEQSDAGGIYVVEVKRFSTRHKYDEALNQAAQYGQQLGLTEITLVLFVEAVDDANRAKYETVYEDVETGVMVWCARCLWRQEHRAQ
jgi:hypothetical protein